MIQKNKTSIFLLPSGILHLFELFTKQYNKLGYSICIEVQKYLKNILFT